MTGLDKAGTFKPDFSKIFEKHKNIYFCQMFTTYYMIYAVIANFDKQQKVYYLLSPGLTVTGTYLFSQPISTSKEVSETI